MNCPQCGGRLSEPSKTCPSCGALLVRRKAPSPLPPGKAPRLQTPTTSTKTGGTNPVVRTDRPAPKRETPPTAGSAFSKNKLIFLGGGVGLLVVLTLITILVLSRPGTPPDRPASGGSSTPPKGPSAPRTPQPPAPPPTLEGKIAGLLDAEKGNPEDLKRWHGEWKKLAGPAEGTPHRQTVLENIDRLEGRANRTRRDLFRPVRERIDQLLKEDKPHDALKVLDEWKTPAELNLTGGTDTDAGSLREILRGTAEIADLRKRYDEDLRAGKDPGDPQRLLEPYLKSSHVGVRSTAESALLRFAVSRMVFVFRTTMAGRKAEALAHIDAILKDIAREKEEEKARVALWEKRLIDSTAKEAVPLEQIGLPGKGSVRISRFDGKTLDWSGDGSTYTMDVGALPIPFYLALLNIAPDPTKADQLFQAGRLALRAGSLPLAEHLFKRTLALDRSYAAIMPDLNRLRVGIGALRGDAEFRGNRLRLVYDFKRPDVAEDFVPYLNSRAMTVPGGLRIEGGPLWFLTKIGNLRFDRELRYRVHPTASAGNVRFAFGIRMEDIPGEEDKLVAVIDPDGKVRVLLKQGDDPSMVLGEYPFPNPPKMLELVFNEKETTLSADGKPLWKADPSPTIAFQPILGGAEISKTAQGGVQYARVEIEGRVAPKWIQEAGSERRAILEAELSKELKLLEHPILDLWLSPGRQFAGNLLQPLSLESRMQAAIPRDVQELLQVWRQTLANLVMAQTLAQAQSAERAIGSRLDEILQKAPWLPFGYYYRAEWKYLRGDTAGALKDLDLALGQHDSFVEARLAKFDLALELKDYTNAASEIEKTIETVPDLAEARLKRALLWYLANKIPEAVSDATLAIRLDPGSLDIRRNAKRLIQVAAGPRWSGAISHETANYVIKAEIIGGLQGPGSEARIQASRDRARAAGATLEIAHDFFSKLLGPPGKRVRKATVYLFESMEAYYHYADLTQGDRLEFSAGVFFPQYQQLLFYRANTEEETLRTMIHEGFHEFMNTIVRTPVPIWLNEGMAEYVSTLKIENGVAVRPGNLVPERVFTLRRALKRGWSGIPFPFILQETHEQFMALSPSLQYAQAWSMVHFFNNMANDRFFPMFHQYINGIINSRPADEVYAETFGKADMPEIQKAWLEYIRKY